MLKEHISLYDKLIQIPKKRKIWFRIDIEQGLSIGKSRFDPPEYQWPKDLLRRLRDHLQEIWNFFSNYSYWFDDSLLPLLQWEDRRVSKDSLIFLLQHDVWGASEVYGAYLIEEAPQEIVVSYYRFDKRVKSFHLAKLGEIELGKWICNDAIRQITDHFTFLWKRLETEIQICITERFQKKELKVESPQYILDQFQSCKTLFNTSKEACLLLLGRLAEHWLLLSLNLKNKPKFGYLAGDAKYRGLIDENDKKLFDNINENYNRLKHWATYQVDTCPMSELLETFEHFLNNNVRNP